ncbi:GNAT family N-acetyltransferase [Paenibacillus chitinolyticus]|uniref:GNAT family N-acetyltransferase n=1 Tax=Paenibacillus chitinolyticus TaxID=79263 RepID=UPI0036D8ABE5
MLYELERKNYWLLEPMLAGGFQFPEVSAVIDSINSGWVVTNDPKHPASALLWAEGLGGFFLLGDETNKSFLHALDYFIDYRLVDSWFEVAGMHEGWNNVIEQHFARRKVNKSTQLIYKWHTQDQIDNDVRAAGAPKTSDSPVQIEQLTAESLSSGLMKNLDFVESELLGFWGSLNQFMQHGVAYCALQEDRIVSICYSGFVARSTHTLGVKTLEPYRQQGLAYWTAKACIQGLRDKKLYPYWDCSSGNEASWRLAQKLGFRKAAEYNLYSIEK